MNRFLRTSLFILVAASQLVSLDAMKRSLDEEKSIAELLYCLQLNDIPRDIDPLLLVLLDAEKRAYNEEKSIADLLYCLQLNDIPMDIDPLIIKRMTLIQASKKFEQSLDTTSPEMLCNSLISICKNLPKLGHLSTTDHELAALLAAQLSKHGKSLLTLVGENKENALHRITKKSCILLPRISRVICMAAGTDAQKLVMMQNDFGYTPLHSAAFYGYSAVVLQVLLSVPDVNVPQLVMMQNNNGETALHKAVYYGHAAIIQALLSAPGVKASLLVNMPNYGGESAFDLARECGRNNISALLLPYMNQNN